MKKQKPKGNKFKPHRVKKSWGYEDWIANSTKYCGKLLFVEQDKGCTVHFHVLKHETFYVHEGTVKVYLIHQDSTTEELVMKPGDCLEVTPGLVHRFVAIGGDAYIYEFSTQHFDTDSYRVRKE